MRALITGIEGFCGRFLAEWLCKQGIHVFGIERIEQQASHPKFNEIEDVGRGDIRDDEFVNDYVHRSEPERIYHLAGITSEPNGLKETRSLYSTNIDGTLNILEAARTHAPKGVIVLIPSSSTVYAPPTPGALPLNESAPLLARNHYGLTKIAQESLGLVYFRKYKLSVVIVRSFNIVGPGQSPAFVCSSLAKQIIEMETGLLPRCLEVGNLNPQRDYVDVRDVVRAFWLATEKGHPGEVYNICSGCGYTVQQILEILLRHSKLGLSNIPIHQTAQRIRTTDEIMFHYGDFSRFEAATGWCPEIPIEQSLTDLLNFWRQVVLHRAQ